MIRRDLESTADVELLVRRFYRAAIPDPLLGPVFHDAGVDWSEHVPKVAAFWSDRLLGAGEYRGNVIGAHQPVLDAVGFGEEHLARWLELWDETVDELFSGARAELAKARAATAGEAMTSLIRRHERGRRSLHLG